MSSSFPCNIPYVLELVAKNIFRKIRIDAKDILDIVEGKPLPIPEYRVLDVGLGFGKWGFLIRDVFDVMLGQTFRKGEWTIDITGVEPFDKCLTPIQEQVYDLIIRKDIDAANEELGTYDLVIMGDVIEHMEKEHAYATLDRLFEKTENIIISTPLGFLPQKAWAGNEYEVHKSGWTLEDFSQYNVVEYKEIKDELFSGLLKEIPGVPEELKGDSKLLVLWLKKK